MKKAYTVKSKSKKSSSNTSKFGSKRYESVLDSDYISQMNKEKEEYLKHEQMEKYNKAKTVNNKTMNELFKTESKAKRR